MNPKTLSPILGKQSMPSRMVSEWLSAKRMLFGARKIWVQISAHPHIHEHFLPLLSLQFLLYKMRPIIPNLLDCGKIAPTSKPLVLLFSLPRMSSPRCSLHWILLGIQSSAKLSPFQRGPPNCTTVVAPGVGVRANIKITLY